MRRGADWDLLLLLVGWEDVEREMEEGCCWLQAGTTLLPLVI